MTFLPMDEEQEEYSFEKFLYERMKEDSEQESDDDSAGLREVSRDLGEVLGG